MVQELLHKIKLESTSPTQFAESLKYLAYSGHDSNLLPFMHALGVSNTQCLRAKIDAYMKGEIYERTNDDDWCELFPDFAAGFVFELGLGFGSEGFFMTTYFNGKKFDICNGAGPQNYPGSCKWEIWVDIFIEKTMDANFNLRCFGDKNITNTHSMEEKAHLEDTSNSNTAGISAWFFVSLVLVFFVLAQGAVILGHVQTKAKLKKQKTGSFKSNPETVSVGQENSQGDEYKQVFDEDGMN